MSDSTEYFGIARWQAWAPGVEGPDAWQAWLKGGKSPEPEAQPDVGQLPPLLRRRLDRCGRMALHTAWPCVSDIPSVQSVFASRHGSLERTLELLGAVAKQEGVSPTSFSLSVHNSTAGLFSISRGDRGATTAMAAGEDTLAMSLLEGANLVAEGAEAVLVCYADDVLPQPYNRFNGHTNRCHPFSVSLLLTPAKGAPIVCRLNRGEADTQAPEAALMRFLLDGEDATLGADQPWRLEHARHAG